MIENALLCGAVPTSNVALGFDSGRAKVVIRVNAPPINLEVTKAPGITFPGWLLGAADEVTE
jgi:hypothetical protein